MSKINKQTILKGSSNEHNLIGNFSSKTSNQITNITVKQECKLIHEKDNQFAEHGTLIIPVGNYEVTNQVEYNPLTQETSAI